MFPDDLQGGVISLLRWLRLGSMTAQVAAIACANWLYEGQLELRPLLWVLLGYALWHAVFLYRFKNRASISPLQVAGEIAFDLLILTALLYFAGGWTNPFVSVYLVPVALAAAVLQTRLAIGIACIALIAYASIVRFHVPLPSVRGQFGGDFALHVIGMWLSFVISTVVLVAAVSFVHRALDRQRATLSRERESRMRDEQLVALGALAASTAHELGTPLTTARLIADELSDSGDATGQIEMLTQQLDYATEKLHALVKVASADTDIAAGSPTELIKRVIDRFRTLRPEVELEQHIESLPRATLGDTRLLEAAVLSLLVNAANASDARGETRVELACRAEPDRLIIAMRDYGPGLAQHVEPGHTAVASERGLGVGLVISSATFERYDGTVAYHRCNPGTQVSVSLPFHALYRAR